MTAMENHTTTEIENISFLSDKPIGGASDDKLGHLSVAKTIKDAIDKWDASRPFTIGLFGGWGTGKSGVGTILAKIIRDTDKDTTAVVEFDIWQYEKDSFRRQFLIFLDGKNGLCTELPQIQNLYKTIIDNEAISPTENKSWYKRLTFWIKAFSIVALLAISGAFFKLANEFKDNSWLNFILNGLGAASVTGTAALTLFNGALNQLFKILLETLKDDWKELFKERKRQIINHQVTYPEKFKEYFDDIITAKLATGVKKIVVIIDNLDRVQDDTILELLSSIKTYLERPEVAFIVQCDDGAIKRHLEHLYHRNSTDSEKLLAGQAYTDEFLRKFFNTYIRIPPFLTGDLDKYTKELLLQTKLPFASDDEVIVSISSSHRGNPRKIKQFINALVSRYLLAYHRENDEGSTELPVGTVSKYPQMLTKVLILEQEYPSFFRQLEEKPYLWNIVDSYINSKILPKDPKEQGQLKEIIVENKDQKLAIFLNATKTITTNDIAPFIFLKQSYASQQVEAGSELKEALEDDNRDKLATLFTEIPSEKLPHYQDFFLELLSKSTNEIRIFNIINALLFSLKEKRIFGKHFYNSLARYVIGDNSGTYALEGFNIELIFSELIPNSDSIYQTQILEKYANFLSNITQDRLDTNIDVAQYRKTFVEQVAKHVNRFVTASYSPIIQNTLTENLFFVRNLRLLNPIFESEEAIKAYISAEYLKKVVSLIVPDDLTIKDKSSYLLYKVRLILKAQSQMNGDVAASLFNKLKDLLAEQNSISEENVAVEINTAVSEALIALRDKLQSFDSLKTLFARLRSNYDSFGNQLVRGIIAHNIFIIAQIDNEDFEPDGESQEMQQFIQQILQSIEHTGLEKLLENSDWLNDVGDLNNQYRDILESRAINQKDVLDLLVKRYNPNFKELLLAKIIKDSPLFTYALQLIDSAKDIENKERIANCLLSRANRENFPEKAALLERLSKVNFNDEPFKQTLLRSLSELLKSTDVNIQRQTGAIIDGYKTASYFSGKDLEKIGEDFIDYLNNQNISDSNQFEGAISYVVRWPLTDNSKNNLANILINKFAINTLENTNYTDKILDWIKTADITYGKYKNQFENLYRELVKKDGNTQKYVANKMLELKLVDGKSKAYQKQLSDLVK